MRIALVVYGSIETVSGGNLYDRALVERLRRQSHEVAIHSLPLRTYARHLADNFSGRLDRKLTTTSYDLILQDELAHPSLVGTNERLKRTFSGRLVSIVHHLRSSEDRPEWQNALYRRVEKRYLRTIDGFVYNSETTRETVESLLTSKTECVVARPAGDRLKSSVSAPEARARALEPGPLRVLFLGNVIPRKGLHYLLRALSELQDLDWRLDVVGNDGVDPAYRRRCGRQASRLGIASRVSFAGSLDDTELARHLSQSQLLVVPSSYEGFGMAYLEAMGFGIPTIATTAGGAEEIVQHGTTGYLVHPGDTLNLSWQLRRLAEDRETLSEMSVAALEAFALHPGWESTTGRIEAFLVRMSQGPPVESGSGVGSGRWVSRKRR